MYFLWKTLGWCCFQMVTESRRSSPSLIKLLLNIKDLCLTIADDIYFVSIQSAHFFACTFLKYEQNSTSLIKVIKTRNMYTTNIRLRLWLKSCWNIYRFKGECRIFCGQLLNRWIWNFSRALNLFSGTFTIHVLKAILTKIRNLGVEKEKTLKKIIDCS